MNYNPNYDPILDERHPFNIFHEGSCTGRIDYKDESLKDESLEDESPKGIFCPAAHQGDWRARKSREANCYTLSCRGNLTGLEGNKVIAFSANDRAKAENWRIGRVGTQGLYLITTIDGRAWWAPPKDAEDHQVTVQELDPRVPEIPPSALWKLERQ